jgi:hypothetical protein
MLMQLRKGFRIRAACVLAVLYALCLLAPAGAFALGDGTRAAHCLTDNNHGLGHRDLDYHKAGASHTHDNAHEHQDAAARQPSGDGGQTQTKPGDCCGLFCLSALAPAADLPLVQSGVLASIPSVNANGIMGRGPDNPYRPPDALLSL